jgi:hypothetical protein
MKKKTARTRQLLHALVEDFGRRKNDAESILLDQGIEIDLTYTIKPSVDSESTPTFSRRLQRKHSPMLEARFEFASEILRGLDTWVGPNDLAKRTFSKKIQSTHNSLRKFWANSAPSLYPDDSLSLFGFTVGVPENIVYLVWTELEEPEIWVYFSQTEEKFENLDAYLDWCLQRT